MRQKIRFWWVSRMEMNAMLPSLHSPVSGSQGGGETRDQGRSRGTKSRNLPGGKTRSCAKIANKVRALMARVGSLINCFHIIHLYSRKITLFLGQQWLGFHKNYPGWNESLHLRFLILSEKTSREDIESWGRRLGGEIRWRPKSCFQLWRKKNSPRPPPFFKERFSSSAVLESRVLLWAIIW